MDKPFKTIEEQVALLESRGISTDENTAAALMREGYYSIVNGYKAPFLDPYLSNSAKDNHYIEGTAFSDIYRLFLLDRSLRELTFHYLIRTEALIRTACAYCFSNMHRAADDYLRFDSYATEEKYTEFGLNLP